MNTTEENKLIAEFMGAISEGDNNIYKIPDERGDDYAPFRCLDLNLEYNTSWDWLMSVVERIEKLTYEVEIRATDCLIHSISEYGSTCMFEISRANKTESTYRAVVEFIKWYNENKK